MRIIILVNSYYHKQLLAQYSHSLNSIVECIVVVVVVYALLNLNDLQLYI